MSMPGAGPPPVAPPPPPMPMMPPQERSMLPTAAGALLVVAGVLGIIQWIQVIAIGGALFGLPFDIGAIIVACGAIGVIFSLIALIGGVMAIQRKMWGLALAGAILGLFTFGYVIGSILALVGLILVAISRREFA